MVRLVCLVVFRFVVGWCLDWFAFVCFVCWFGWVFVCFVDCLVVVAGACVCNIRHVLDLLGIDSVRPQRPWDARWIDVWRSWRRQGRVIQAVVGLGVSTVPFNYSSHCSKCKKATHKLY